MPSPAGVGGGDGHVGGEVARGKGEGVGVQQAVEEDLGDDDEDAGVGVDAAVAGDQADVVGAEAPANGGGLHLLEFLFGQGDEGSGVVGDGACVQRLEEGGLGDEGLAGAGGGADEDALLGAEPGEQGVLLHGVGRVGQLVEVARGEVVAGRGSGVHESVHLKGE